MKKAIDPIKVDWLDEDDSKIGIASEDIRDKLSPANKPSPFLAKIAPAQKMPPPPTQGFNASMKKKEAQTDVSIYKKENENDLDANLSPNDKTKASPGLAKIVPKYKMNVVAPMPTAEVSSLLTERPYNNSTDRNLLNHHHRSENYLMMDRRDARVVTRLKNITENFQRELGVAHREQAYNAKDLLVRQESHGNRAPKESSKYERAKLKNVVDMEDGVLAKTKLSKLQKYYVNFNNNKLVSQIMGIIIMISIFGDDMRRVMMPPSYDYYVDGFMTFLMALFILEMIANAWILKRSYLLSFDLWFDMFSTMSMLMDVTYFSEAVLATWQRDASSSSAAASQLGTRLSKILKMVRLVRLLRLSKALSKSEAAMGEKKVDEMVEAMNLAEKQIDKINKKKKSGKVGDSPSKKQSYPKMLSRKGTLTNSLQNSKKYTHRAEEEQDFEINLNLEKCRFVLLSGHRAPDKEENE